MLADRFGQPGPGVGIAEDAMFDTAMQRVDDSRRRRKIHVGHPQRQDVGTGIAIPFDRVGECASAAIDDPVEIEALAQTSRCE